MPFQPASQGAAGAAPVAPAVVLDTNAVLDWLLFDDPGMRPAAEAIRSGQLHWITCPRLREELVHTLRKPVLVARLSETEADSERLLSLFDELSQATADPPAADAQLRCRDATDQVFLDLALAHGAAWLLTHDRALRALRRRAAARGLAILPPAAWRPLSATA
jgi:putative PIN family toxin of toxin-antitoxin system